MVWEAIILAIVACFSRFNDIIAAVAWSGALTLRRAEKWFAIIAAVITGFSRFGDSARKKW